MINRADTHKKIELSNNTHALLCDYKNKVFQHNVRKGNHTNLSFDDIILLMIHKQTEIQKEVDEYVRD